MVCEVKGSPASFYTGNGSTTLLIMLRRCILNKLRFVDTDLPAYSDTVYSDTPLTVTLLACPN